MSELICVASCGKADRAGDLVFIHGLDGDARTTWQRDNDDVTFWPAWLGTDLPQVGVWSVDYDAASLVWRGTTMPLTDRAANVLLLLDVHGIGDRPLVFVTHSMGGLLVKQMLRHARDFGTPRWKAIAAQTKGIVFLATPHSGAGIATLLQHIAWLLRGTVSLRELQAHDARLRELNTWFVNNIAEFGCQVEVYHETQNTHGVRVVDETSATPGIAGVIPIPMDSDHATICKPASRDSLLYLGVKRFVEQCLASTMPTPAMADIAPAVAPASSNEAPPIPAGKAGDQPAKKPYRYDVFISYRHGEADQEFARKLLRDLEEAGYRAAIDARDFRPQESFLEEMERCIQESRFTVAVVSPRYLESGNTTEEAIITKVRDMQDRSRRLIRVTIEPTRMPLWLFNLVGIDFTESDPLVPPLDRLRQALNDLR